MKTATKLIWNPETFNYVEVPLSPEELDEIFGAKKEANLSEKEVVEPLITKKQEPIRVPEEYKEKEKEEEEGISFFEDKAKGLVPTFINNVVVPSKQRVDVGRVSYKFLTGVPSLIEEAIFNPLAGAVLSKESKVVYDKAIEKIGSKFATSFARHSLIGAYTTLGDVEDIADPETGKAKDPETVEGTILNVGILIATAMKTGAQATLAQVPKLGRKLSKLSIFKRGLIGEQFAEQVIGFEDFNSANALVALGNNFEKDTILRNTLAHPWVEAVSADELDSDIIKRVKLSFSALLMSSGIIKSLDLLGVGYKQSSQLARKMYGTTVEKLSKQQAEGMFSYLVFGARSNQIKAPSSQITSIREVKQADAEGVNQLVSQTTEQGGNFLKSIRPFFERKIRRYFTSRGFSPEKVFQASQESLGRSRALTTYSQQIAIRLQNKINKLSARYTLDNVDDPWLSGRGPIQDPKLVKNVSQALETNMTKIEPAERLNYLMNKYDLPEDLAVEILEARTLIDDLSESILDSKIGGEVVRESISKNIGRYVNRSYRLFSEFGYKPSANARLVAENYFRKKIVARYKRGKIEITNKVQEDIETEITRKIAEILDTTKAKDLDTHVGNIQKINSNLLKGREDLPVEIRNLMGEIDKPSLTVLSTVQKLTDIIESNKYWDDVMDLGASVPTNKSLFNEVQDAVADNLSKMNLRKVTVGSFVKLPIAGLDETTTLAKVVAVKGGKLKPNQIRIQYKVYPTGKFKTKVINKSDLRKGSLVPDDAQLARGTKNAYVKEARRLGMDNDGYTEALYIFNKEEGPFWASAKIEGTGSKLDGMYTSPELKLSLEGLEDTFLMSNRIKNSPFFNKWRYAKGVSQQMKTVWSHTTQLRNAFGGVQFSIHNGISPVENGRLSLSVLKNEVLSLDDKALSRVYTIFQEMGVINTSVRMGEWQNLMRSVDGVSPDVFAQKMSDFVGKVTRTGDSIKVGKGVIQLPQKMYMAVDDFFKINAFAHELKYLKRAHRGDRNWDFDKLTKEAARIVKNTFPNYDLVPKGVKALRSLPLGNFVAFTPEMIRTQAKILLQAVDEFKSGNKVLQERAMWRTAGAASVHGGWATAGAYGYKLTGLTKEQNEALQVFAETDYDKNHNKIFFRLKDGRIFGLSPKHINAYEQGHSLAGTFHQAMKEGRFKGEPEALLIAKSAVQSLLGLVDFASDTSMLATTGTDLWAAWGDPQGRRKDGKQILSSKDFDDQFMDSLNYIFKSLGPGFVTKGSQSYDAAIEKPHQRTGHIPSFGAALTENITGFNPRELVFKINLVDFVDRYQGTIAYREKKARPGSMKLGFGGDVEDYVSDIMKQNAQRLGAQQDLYRKIVVAENILGHKTTWDIIEDETSLTASQIRSFMNGRFDPTFPSEDQWDEAREKFGRNEVDKVMRNYLAYVNMVSRVRLHPTEQEEDIIKLKRDIKRTRQVAAADKLLMPKNYSDLDKMTKEGRTYTYAKGGLVTDVPKTSKEPDERIDKMTGLPYDEQAGEAFEDIEDRLERAGGGAVDPLVRLGFTGGGSVDPLVRLGFTGGGAVDPLVRLGFTGGGSVDPLVRLGFATGSFVYEIEKGDTLSEIAETQGVSQAELQRINKIEDPDRIFAGAEIIIPVEEEPVEVAPEITPEITPEFTQEDTANLAAGMIQELVASDRDLEQELAAEEKRGRSFSFFPEAQTDTLESPPEAPEDYSGVWGGGMRQLHHSLNQTKKDLDAGQITQLEAGIRSFGARIDMAFAPVGELIGTVASALTPDIIEDPIKGKVGEMVQEVAEFLEENPGWKRSAKNVNALVSILGLVPAAQILKTGTNMFAAGTKQKLNNFYNVKKGVKFKTVTALDEAGNKIKVQKEIPITRPFVNKAEQVASQTKAAGFAFMQAVPEAVVDALVPGMMARRGAGVAGSKRKEILEAGKYIDIGAGDHFAAVVGARNIIDQSPNLDRGKLIKDGSIERAYVYGTVKMSNKKKVKASLFNDYNDFPIPEAIQKRAMRHLYAGPWTEGIGINVRGRKISSERPLNPKNTDIDIKRLDGPQKLIHESHADFDTAANSLRKLFKESNRIKIAKYVNQLNPDGTIKSGVKLNKEGKITKASLKVNRNKGVDVDKALNNITPEQIKSWLAFDAGGKQGAGVKFKSDPKNSDIIYWSDTHTSKSKESGGVNNFIAMDFKTKDVYVMVSDKHDILANLNPIGGSSRLTVSPMTKRNFGDINKRGEHTQRDFQGEAQAALKMLKKENMELPEGGLSIPQYDPIIGVIPIGTKTESVIGGAKTTLDDLKKIAKAKDVEKRKDGWYVDGEKMAKEKLDGAVNVNATVLAHYSGKATAADYGTLVRRVGKIYSGTAGGGESMPSAVRAGLYSGGKVFSALKRVS